MRLFKSKQQVIIYEAVIKKASEFAEKVTATTDYSDSNQFNLIKIKEDHFISKIGEEAVKAVFEKFGMKVQGPDYTVYEKDRKSWAPDLYIDNKELAVKTQKKTAADRYGLSWTFQFSELRKDTILCSADAWVCFVECDDKSKNFNCIVYPPYQIKELTFSEPILKRLKGKKKVVYASDLPNL